MNMELMKEVGYFGDIVIVPYMDNYDLVVLKTVAICEYGVKSHNKTSTWLFVFFLMENTECQCMWLFTDSNSACKIYHEVR